MGQNESKSSSSDERGMLNDELITAARDGLHTSHVQHLVTLKADPNATGENGWTALMACAINGYTVIARELVELKADVNATDQRSIGQLETARLLVELKADVNAAQKDGFTSLMNSAQNGHLDIVRSLVELKADVHARRPDGLTSVMSAAQSGHTDIVRFLVASAADPNATMESGRSALMECAFRGHAVTARALVELKADVNAADNTGVTSLMCSAQEGHLDTASLLIELKADLHARRQDCGTSLMSAARKGHTDIVRFLVASAADLNATMESGRSALMECAFRGHAVTARALVELKADVNAADKDGFTSLMGSAQNGHLDTARSLVELKADVHARRPDGLTSVMSAAQSGHTDIVRFLIASAADPNAAMKSGRSALMECAFRGHAVTARALVELKADVNAADKNGGTSLMSAAWNGHTDIVRFLVASGASVNVIGKDGTTYLLVSSLRGHRRTFDALLELKADVQIASHPFFEPQGSPERLSEKALLDASFSRMAEIPEDLSFLEHAGSGGFGDVQFADYKGERVAVKRMTKRSGRPFYFEMTMLAVNSHANIVRFIGYTDPGIGEGDGLVSEALDTSIAALVRHRPLSSREVLFIATGVARALAFLHGRNVLHRDIKGANVLVNLAAAPPGPDAAGAGGGVGNEGGANSIARLDGAVREVKVCDMGLAIPWTDERASGGAGTPAWMAPEAHRARVACVKQIRGLPVDMYGFGLLMYEVWTGIRSSISWTDEHTSGGPGTPASMAPEAHRAGVADRKHARALITAKSDVYSFGMLLYELCTRLKPFAGMHEREYRATDDERPPLACISSYWRSLISGCVQTRPEDRPDMSTILSELTQAEHKVNLKPPPPLVSDGEMHTSLAHHLGVRQLSDGELRLVADAVARALCGMHACGLLSGVVSCSTVLVNLAQQDEPAISRRAGDVVTAVLSGVASNRISGGNELKADSKLLSEVHSAQMDASQPLHYLAPELLRLHAQNVPLSRGQNVLTDVYSFGMLLYEMATRRPPFDGVSDWAERVKNGERPPLDGVGVPDGLDRLIRWCWQQQSWDRPRMRQVLGVLHPAALGGQLPSVTTSEESILGAKVASLSMGSTPSDPSDHHPVHERNRGDVDAAAAAAKSAADRRGMLISGSDATQSGSTQ